MRGSHPASLPSLICSGARAASGSWVTLRWMERSSVTWVRFLPPCDSWEAAPPGPLLPYPGCSFKHLRSFLKIQTPGTEPSDSDFVRLEWRLGHQEHLMCAHDENHPDRGASPGFWDWPELESGLCWATLSKLINFSEPQPSHSQPWDCYPR